MDRQNDATWQHLPADPWGVYVDQQKADGIDQHIYIAFDKSADDRAGKPFTQAEAEAFAEQINVGAKALVATAQPLEQTLQPGI